MNFEGDFGNPGTWVKTLSNEYYVNLGIVNYYPDIPSLHLQRAVGVALPRLSLVKERGCL